MANTVVMLFWKKSTLITPVALFDALMDPPVPEIPELAQALGSICLCDIGSAYYLECRLTLAQVQSML